MDDREPTHAEKILFKEEASVFSQMLRTYFEEMKFEHVKPAVSLTYLSFASDIISEAMIEAVSKGTSDSNALRLHIALGLANAFMFGLWLEENSDMKTTYKSLTDCNCQHH